jgi:hypothetical protein
VRWIRSATSCADVPAWLTATACACERRLTLNVTVLAAVSLKPTMMRSALGPRDTACARTGLRSGLDPEADEFHAPEAARKSSAYQRAPRRL